MTAVKEALAGKEFPSAGKVFVAVGTAMMSSMGGASGAIFGFFSAPAARRSAIATEFTAAGLATLLREGTDQVMTKGAKPGDKTMVDALFPAAAKAAEVSGEPVDEALVAVAAAAAAGRDASKDMIADDGPRQDPRREFARQTRRRGRQRRIILAAMSDFCGGLVNGIPFSGSKALTGWKSRQVR